MERTATLSVSFILMFFLGLSQGHQHLMKKTPSSAFVVGTVYCDTCFNGAFSKPPNHLIPGALVAVECIAENSKPSFRQEVKTDENGEFKAKLPFSASKRVKKIKRCSVKLLSSSQPYCSIATSATSSSSSLKRLKLSKHGAKTRVFSAGFFAFKHQNKPENFCSQKPINLRNTKSLLPDHSFPPPIQDPVPSPSSLIPNLPILPPLPELPLPQLPPLFPPGLQKSSSLLNKKEDSLEDKKVLNLNFLLPPNPLNPPSIIPPNPLITSPPTPLPFQPPSAPAVPPVLQIPTLPPLPVLPLVPILNPPSLPSVPLPPIFPGIPPASSSFSSHHQP